MAEENKKIPELKSASSKTTGLDKQPVSRPNAVLKTPKEWAVKLKVKLYYLAGASVYAHWKDDRKISQAEFERKLNEWLKRPVGGRR